jgi:uncharacterized membrane protein YhiD involved in acid resistance
MKDNKKIITMVILLIILFTSMLIVTVKNNKEKIKDQPSTKISNNKADNDVTVDKIIFSNITKVYDGGITTLKAKMLNSADKTQNFKLEIILKDDNNKEVESVIQIIENLEPNKAKILTTGIAGDYTNIKNIEFKVMEIE